MGKKGRKENRQYRIVTHTSHNDDFQRKYGTGQRSAEYRCETGSDTNLYHNLTVVRMHPEEARQKIGYGPSHLYPRTFPSGRPPEQMGQYRTDINQRSHLERNNIPGTADFFNQKIVSPGSRACQVMIHQPDEQSGQRQQTDDPDMTLPVISSPSKRNKQQGRCRTDYPTGNGSQDKPFQTIPESDFFETGPTKTILQFFFHISDNFVMTINSSESSCYQTKTRGEIQLQSSCPFCAQNRLTTGTISYFS